MDSNLDVDRLEELAEVRENAAARAHHEGAGEDRRHALSQMEWVR
jgi:hypothetical protein